MSHANARLTVHGRRVLVERVLAGHRVCDVAAQLGVSRATVYKWRRRFITEGAAGLSDRSSRPHRSPSRVTADTEQAILELRRRERRGQDWIAGELGVCPRTAGRVITRAGLPRLDALDAVTGEAVRRGPRSDVRYERDRPGELVHVDVKKLGRIPDGGGWRVHGRGPKPTARRGRGFDYVHSAVDDHTRLAYSEIHPDERGETCAAFLIRAARFFAGLGITRIERVMTDNALAYRQPRVHRRLPGARDAPGVHPSPLPLDQRQSRAPEPHAPDGMGLRTPVHLERRARPGPATLAPLLQPQAPPQQPRRATTDQPPVNNLLTNYT